LFRRSAKSIQRLGNGGLDFARAVAAQLPVHFFQPPDQVENFPADERSAGGLAKMRAATEWTVGVNDTAPGLAFEKGARTVGIAAPRGGWSESPAPHAAGVGG